MAVSARRSLGLDFGTTNTVLAWADAHRPAVRRLFERRFGADRVDAGNEFVSIANGLATIGLREDVEAWTVASAAEPAR